METRAVAHYVWMRTAAQTWLHSDRPFMLILGLSVVLWASVASSGTRYSYTTHDLSFPGSSAPEFTGISEQRKLVGTFWDAQGDSWAFRKQGKTEARLYLTGHDASPKGINDRGEIVGTTARREYNCYNEERAMGFLYANDMPLWYDCYTFPIGFTGTGVEFGVFHDPNDNQAYCYTRAGESINQFQLPPAASWLVCPP
jgi:hypothetical protein